MSSLQKALLLERKNGKFYVDTRPIPKPGRGELLVKVKAFALNPVDWKVQEIDFSFRKDFPAVLGSDIAGDVEEVGEGVQGWKKGDRVWYQGNLGNNDFGAFQQYSLAPAEFAIKCPDNASYEQVSTIPVAFLAAAYGLLAHAPLGAGLADANLKPEADFSRSSALIIGGTTSVGQFVIQLLKYLGFNQILTYASGHQASFLQSLGATDIIDRKKVSLDDLPSVVAQRTVISIAYDAVGTEETQNAGNKCVPNGGTLISSLPKQVVELGDSGKKFFAPMAVVHIPECREFGKLICGRLEEWVSKGVIKPSPVETLPTGLEAVVDGLDRLRNNRVSGVKLVGRML